jgi:hypothetical protein
VTQVFYASTTFGAVSLAAALDAGCFGEPSQRRVLITSTNTKVPEISPGVAASVAFAPLRHRFDDVVVWNDVIAPLHPSRWVPPVSEIPMLARLMRGALGLDDAPVTELVLESVAVAPARSIGVLLGDCPITVYSDGLMSYGPTRDDLPVEIGRRAARLLYLDLVPELTPLLLRENEARAERIPDAAFTKVIAELPGPRVAAAVGAPMIIGQYLSDLGLLTPAEELALHDEMLRALAARGHRQVVFKPHPGAVFSQLTPLRAEAARLGLELTIADDGLPAEVWFDRARPALVVSCFSTALLTAARYYKLPTATLGAELMLERIVPYQNSNRIPITLVDALVPRLAPDGELHRPDPPPIERLVSAVGYCMQPDRNPQLRGAAEAHLRAYGPDRYFKKRRLERLGLVGTPLHRAAGLRRAVRRVRRTARRLRTSARHAFG